MAKLSVVIITKNEEENIKQCLESVKWADEIIVVDSFSTDKTVEIAKQYTKKIFLNDNSKCINLNKNLGMEKATGDWILVLDADEIVTPKLAAKLKEILRKDDKHFDGYSVIRECNFLGKWMRHGGWYEYEPKMVRKGKGSYPKGLHDALRIDGKVGYLENSLLHYNFKTVSEWINKMDFYTALEANEMEEKGLKFSVGPAFYSPIGVFFRQYFSKAGFKDGLHGFTAAIFAAFYDFVKHAKLWEKRKSKYRKE